MYEQIHVQLYTDSVMHFDNLFRIFDKDSLTIRVLLIMGILIILVYHILDYMYVVINLLIYLCFVSVTCMVKR